ncbi:MAG: CocE/NonD family hydrolase [Pseudomonadota bacterium]
MASPAQRETLTIEGPAGDLEALIERPNTDRSALPVAVVCHPHPAHGGAMTNKVTHTLARAFVLTGHIAVRFNFRGVGKSQGAYDEGIGELQDTLAVIDWARAEFGVASLSLGGFSFGAAMAVQASNARTLAQLVLVAPPVGRILSPAARVPDGLPALVVQGEQDDIVDPDAVVDWVNAQASGIRLVWMQPAGHFFHGHLPDLRQHLVGELSADEASA